MTTITTTRPERTHPRAPRLRAGAATLGRTMAALGRRAIAPHRASLTNLARIPLTFSGAGCVDYAAFHVASGLGWLVTGISLVLIEHVIADETD